LSWRLQWNDSVSKRQNDFGAKLLKALFEINGFAFKYVPE
jgi:hypothetical protein